MDIALLDQAKAIARRQEQHLLGEVQRFDDGIAAIKKQLGKLKNLKAQTEVAGEHNRIRASSLKEDVEDSRERLALIRQKLKDFDRHITKKDILFKSGVDSIEDTKIQLSEQQQYVQKQIKELNNASIEFEFNNCFTRRLCVASRGHSLGVYNRWLNLVPQLQLFLANENKIHSSIYNSAMLEGLSEELMAHFEAKKNILRFQELFRQYTDEELGQLRDDTNSVALEEQNRRSEEFDAMHSAMHSRIRSASTVCDTLYADISAREELRRELNSFMINLCNVLESDMANSLNNTEKVSTKPLGEIMNEIRETERTAEKKDKQPASTVDEYNRELFGGGHGQFGEMLVTTPKTSTRNNTRMNALTSLDEVPVMGSSLEEEGGAGRNRTRDMIENLISNRYQWYIAHHSNTKYTRAYKHCQSPHSQAVLERLCSQTHFLYPEAGILPLQTRVKPGKTSEPFTDYTQLASITEEGELPLPGADASPAPPAREVVPILPTDITSLSVQYAPQAARKPLTKPPTDKPVRGNISYVVPRAEDPSVGVSVPESTDPQRPTSPQEDPDELDEYTSMFASLNEELNKYDNAIDNALAFNASASVDDTLLSLKTPSIHQIEPVVHKAFAGINQTQTTAYANLADIGPDTFLHYKQLCAQIQYASAALSYDSITKVSEVLEASMLNETTDEEFRQLSTSQMHKHTALQQQLIEVARQNEERLVAAKGLFSNARNCFDDWLTRSISANYKSAILSMDALVPTLNLYAPLPNEAAAPTPGGYAWDEYGSEVEAYLGESFVAEDSQVSLDQLLLAGGMEGGSSSITVGMGSPAPLAQPPMKRAPRVTDDLTVKNMMDITNSLLSQINTTLVQYTDQPEEGSPYPSPMRSAVGSPGFSPGYSPENVPHSPPDAQKPSGGRARHSIIKMAKEQEQHRRQKTADEEHRKDLTNMVWDPSDPNLPKTDKLLGTLETIMHGELYVISIQWNSRRTGVDVLARCFTSTTDCKEYSLFMPAIQLCALINCHAYSVLLHLIANDTAKFCQTLIYNMKIEFIDPVYYDIVTNAVQLGGVGSHKFDINKMLVPEFKLESLAPQRPLEHLLAILTVRAKKDQKLLEHCHVTLHKISENK